MDSILQCIETVITSDQNEMLMAPVSVDEVKAAVFSMYPEKSPGPDGMNPAFYQRYWNIVGSDVVKACLCFLNNCEFPVGLNNTNIVLIPKKDCPETMADLRPISLCNVLYKVVGSEPGDPEPLGPLVCRQLAFRS